MEDLHDGRLDDFLQGKEILRAADMANTTTYEADHNTKNITDLIADFKAKRTVYIKRIESLDNETLKFKSSHPRLQTLVRPVDMAYFTAEHDDHHLADMREILNNFNQSE